LAERKKNKKKQSKNRRDSDNDDKPPTTSTRAHFNDIVQAPPSNLPLPRKAKPKMKQQTQLKSMREQVALEQARSEVIQLYRLQRQQQSIASK
jgi:hypothetical protein